MSAYATSHGWTPHVNNPFSDGSYCRVMLARYACPYSKEEHDPALPPVDVDVFGYRRKDRPAPSGEADEPTTTTTAKELDHE
jgi:hypothetical protein